MAEIKEMDEEESVQKSGAKWLIVTLIVSAIFAALIILAYVSNEYRRNGPRDTTNPVGTNSRG